MELQEGGVRRDGSVLWAKSVEWYGLAHTGNALSRQGLER